VASRRYKFLPHLLQFRRVPFLHWGRIGKWAFFILMIGGFTARWAYLFFYWWPTPPLKARREALQEKELTLQQLASYRDTVLRLTREAEALEKELYLSLVPAPDTPAKASTKTSAVSVAWPTEDTLAAYLLRVETYLYQLTRAEALLQSPILRSRWLPRRLPCACRELAVGFGQAHHPILGTPYPHRGIDFLVGEGAPIRTTAEGVVIKVEPVGGGEGTRVYVQHRPDLVTVYYPVAAQVQVGQGLAAGTPLGTLQRITLARAPFLHYEVWVRGEAVDPLPYLWGDLAWTERARWKAAFARQTYALH